MDITKLKAEFPDVYQTAIEEGKKQGLAASKETHLAEGKAIGQIEERKRISGIKALALPGQEKLADSFVAEGVTEAEAAVKFLAAQKEALSKIKVDMETELNKGVVSDVPAKPKDPEASDSSLTPEQQFEKSAELKAEFGGDIDRYKAFLKAYAAGRAKILNRGGK